MKKMKEYKNRIKQKVLEKAEPYAWRILVFVGLSMLISIVWYGVEEIAFEEIRRNGRDTWICLIVSFLLTMAVFSRPAKTWFQQNKPKFEWKK